MNEKVSSEPESNDNSEWWKTLTPIQFLFSALHELRTPILTIKGYATILADETHKEMHPRAIEAILSNVERLDLLWTDMMNYSREIMRKSDIDI